MSTEDFSPTWFSKDECAELLITRSALGVLDHKDALVVTNYMHPMQVVAGVSFIKEGSINDTHYMLLVLEGDVTIESKLSGDDPQSIVSVVGPGALIGEMGVLDHEPRSATCTAYTDLKVAVLTRDSLLRLVTERPSVGVNLLMALSKRLSNRLRETTQKLNKFVRLNRALDDEINKGYFSR
jgi:CRP/FNR family transcriptional regulator, cyclic AMP receptor protein